MKGKKAPSQARTMDISRLKGNYIQNYERLYAQKKKKVSKKKILKSKKSKGVWNSKLWLVHII